MSLDRRGSITVGKRFSAASNADSGRPEKDSELIVELLNRLMVGNCTDASKSGGIPA